MEPKHLESKALTCMDEDLTIEITRPKDESRDLIIAVSITCTYVFTDQSVPLRAENEITYGSWSRL